MASISFDLNKKDDSCYTSHIGFQQVNVYSLGNSFVNYDPYFHVYGVTDLKKNFIFNLKYKYDTAQPDVDIDVELPIPFDKYNFHGIEVYYRRDNRRVGPVMIGVNVEPCIEGAITTEQVKQYYIFREMINSVNNGTVKLNHISHIEEEHLEKRIIDLEYKALNTVLKVNVHSSCGEYKSSFAMDEKIKSEYPYFNVEGNGPDEFMCSKESNRVEFVMFTHTIESELFNKAIIDCDNCFLDKFNPYDYNDLNLECVKIYFHKRDIFNVFPLMIEFKSKADHMLKGLTFENFGTRGGSVFYGLVSIEHKKIDLRKIQQIKSFAKIKSLGFKKSYSLTYMDGMGLIRKLQSISDKNGVKDKINAMYGYQLDPRDVFLYKMTIACILGFIVIPMGTLIYMNMDMVHRFARRLCRLFR